jgi:tRNA (adenine57-N1/adenine58-N1)-methyltransferase catalytic subunit
MKVITNGTVFFYVKNSSADYHCASGIFSRIDMQSLPSGSTIYSHSKEPFTIFDATPADYFAKLGRGAAIINPKDIGQILSVTSVNKTSIVADAGSGSGSLAIALGLVAKEVHTFDIKPDHVSLVQKNVTFFGLTNVFVKHGDVYQDVDVGVVDVFTLDVPDAVKALPTAISHTKIGGFIVCYVTQVTQAHAVCSAVKSTFSRCVVVKVSETIERDWVVDELRARPEHTGLLHTGFLVFLRVIR